MKRTRPRHLPWTAAPVPVLALVLAAPALATTPVDTFHVNSNGNGAKSMEGPVCIEALGKCTLRAAIEAAEADPGLSEIQFTEPFNGEEASAIDLHEELLPSITKPVDIEGQECGPTPCVRLKDPVLGHAVLNVTSTESEIYELTIVGGSLGVRLGGSKNVLQRDRFVGNTTGTGTAIEITGNEGLVESNTINELSPSAAKAMAIRGNANHVYGNLIERSGLSAIAFELGATGNQIGASWPESENVIEHSEQSPIFLSPFISGPTRNEIGRNHGTGNGGPFILIDKGNEGVGQPVITSAYPTTVSGTATAEGEVRLFETGETTGDVIRFLGEVGVDEHGVWKATVPALAVGAHVAATQTVEGEALEAATSEFSGVSTVTAEQTPPPANNGGGTTTTTPVVTPIFSSPSPLAPMPPVKKKPLKCKKGFAKKKVKGKARCVRVTKHHKRQTNSR